MKKEKKIKLKLKCSEVKFIFDYLSKKENKLLNSEIFTRDKMIEVLDLDFLIDKIKDKLRGCY